MDVEEDMRRAGVTEEREARDRVRWSPMIHCRCALMTRCSYISCCYNVPGMGIVYITMMDYLNLILNIYKTKILN